MNRGEGTAGESAWRGGGTCNSPAGEYSRNGQEWRTQRKAGGRLIAVACVRVGGCVWVGGWVCVGVCVGCVVNCVLGCVCV